MPQHIELDYLDPVHEGFFDPIQEMISPSAHLRIVVASTTTLQALAGANNDQSSVSIEGKYRYRNTNTAAAALPGGLTDGVGDVYVTTADNNFTGPLGDPDAPTDYSFSLAIVTSGGTPAGALKRKVGEVDVSGGAIVRYRPMADNRRWDRPVLAKADHASQAALVAQGAAGQTGDIFRVEADSGTSSGTGTSHLRVAGDGSVTIAQGATIQGAAGLTLSGAGDKDTLNLSSTVANTGITIGGDVTLYRPSADVIQSDDAIRSRRGLTGDVAFGAGVTGDVDNRLVVYASGTVAFGTGAGAPDALANLYRGAAGTVKTDGTFNAAAGLQVGGVALAASHLSNGVTGTGNVVLKTGPVLVDPTANTQAEGTNNLTLATTAFAARLVPTGTILPTALAAAPSGFLMADGTAKSRTTYAALFAAIGTTYGAGDGSTTFNVPNLTDRVPLGKGAGSTLGQTGGAATVTLTAAQSGLRAHNHGFTGGALPTHAHAHTLTLPTHAHSFTGDALPTHAHSFTGGALPNHHHLAGGLVHAHTHDMGHGHTASSPAHSHDMGHGHTFTGGAVPYHTHGMAHTHGPGTYSTNYSATFANVVNSQASTAWGVDSASVGYATATRFALAIVGISGASSASDTAGPSGGTVTGTVSTHSGNTGSAAATVTVASFVGDTGAASTTVVTGETGDPTASPAVTGTVGNNSTAPAVTGTVGNNSTSPSITGTVGNNSTSPAVTGTVDATTSVLSSGTDAASAHENLPPYQVVNYMIKT